MLSREMLARRLREARRERALTLKQVEQLSGFSSTHVSEIERGRTTPTVDALVRIASALGRDPCYFIEERALGEVSIVSPENDPAVPALEGAGEFRRLTPGVLGGRMEMSALRVARPSHGVLNDIGAGFVCIHVLEGSIVIAGPENDCHLSRGMSLHTRFRAAPEITVEAAPAEIIFIRDPEAAIEEEKPEDDSAAAGE